MTDGLSTLPQESVSSRLETVSRAPWSGLRRFGFRLSFFYWVLYVLLNANITLFFAFPVVGQPIQRGLAMPVAKLAEWVGAHGFHLDGIAARWHGGGSGDTTLDYVRILCFATIAVVGAIAWSALDRRRMEYGVMLLWLRWLLRLTLGIALVFYGMAKLFPLQMRPPSLGILTNTFGNSSPMTLLWTLLGLNPLYQMFCGAAELAAGILLLIRRTATLGSILAFALCAQIVLYNFFFDVPVKLFASHLLMMSAYLVGPDVPPLWRLFVRQLPAQLTGEWHLPVRTDRLRKGLLIAETVFALAIVGQLTYFMQKSWRNHRAAQAPTPISGAWQVESIEPENATRPLSPEGEPWTALYIDDRRAGFYRSRDGALWRCGFQYNEPARKLGIRAVKFSADYLWELSDPDHLLLSQSTIGREMKITFRRIDTPKEFPLLTRGFHWVNEWGYER
jgi:hypothetical protein